MKTIDQRIENMRGRLVEMGHAKESKSIEESVQNIQAAACAALRMPHNLLTAETRTRRSSWARWLCYKHYRERLKLTLCEIAAIHKKDHGTVLHGLQKFNDACEVDEDFRNAYQLTVKLLSECE